MKAKAVIAAPILLLVIFLCNFGSSFIPPEIIGTENDPYIVASLIQLFILVIPTLIFCRLRGGKYMKRLRFKGFRSGHTAFMFFALLLMFFGSCGINYLMHILFPDANVSSGYDNADGFAGGLYLVLTMAVIPAITEEFLFRGVILAEYETEGVPSAVLLSSITFAMLHFSFAKLPAYIFCGLILAVVLYTTRSIFAAMLVHMLNNTATIFFGDLIFRAVSSQGVVLFCLILVLFILLSAILMFGECERIYASYGVLNEDSSYTGKRKKGRGMAGIIHSIFAPIFMLLVILYIVIAAIGI
ncbi:MAG: CPBP family intramembrane metalloprotease [Ruminococcaceae bacterium]|nr:CPBP family intramembrane metalloprotease [Oscillospiraceae bacterium]